jgi:hypothetical protein
MRVDIIDEAKQADWDRFVDTNPNVIAWHSFYYSHVLRSMYGLTFYPMAAYDGGAVCGILPLYLSETRRRGRLLMSVPYFVAGGIVAVNEEAEQRLLKRAIELAREVKAAHVVLRQYRKKIQGDLVTDDGYYNRELSLTANLDDVAGQISQVNKAKIEEAKGHGAVLEYPSQELGTYYDFLLRDQHALGIPCVSKKWVELLLGTKTYKIALLKSKGTIVAATLAKTFKDTISFPLTCLAAHDERGELFAYDLYWKLITRVAREGIRICHSGRIPRGDAVPAYRLGWGGAVNNYYYQSPGVEGTTAHSPNTRGTKRSFFESVWRRTPVGLARALGPVIVTQFP